VPQTHPSMPYSVLAHRSRAHKFCSLLEPPVAAMKDGSVAPRPPAGPMPLFPSANRNLDNSKPQIDSLAWDQLGIRNALRGLKG